MFFPSKLVHRCDDHAIDILMFFQGVTSCTSKESLYSGVPCQFDNSQLRIKDLFSKWSVFGNAEIVSQDDSWACGSTISRPGQKKFPIGKAILNMSLCPHLNAAMALSVVSKHPWLPGELFMTTTDSLRLQQENWNDNNFCVTKNVLLR